MRPFSTDADALVFEQQRIRRQRAPGRRRGRSVPRRRSGAARNARVRRQLSIKLGPVEGVCVVRLGNTIACASTTGALGPTSGGASSEGSLRVMWISRAGRRRVRQGRESVAETRQRAQDLGALLERGLKEARAVDVESLCVLAGKRVW